MKKIKTGVGFTSGKFFNNLKTLYKNDNCCVKLNEGLTNTFVANQGVKQGCIVSPLLFNIFLADLPRHLTKDECIPLELENSNPISCLMWADDILLISEMEEGLQLMLNNLLLYARKNGMKIYADKTKSMIFNKSGKFFMRSFKFDNENILLQTPGLMSVVNLKHTSIQFKRNEFANFRTKEYIKLEIRGKIMLTFVRKWLC